MTANVLLIVVLVFLGPCCRDRAVVAAARRKDVIVPHLVDAGGQSRLKAGRLKHDQFKHHLKQHYSFHLGHKKHQCPFCDYSSPLSGNVKTHVHAKHRDRLAAMPN